MMALAAVALSPDQSFAQALPAPKVILLRPPAAPAAVSEALVRLQAELTVEGFDAQVIDFDLGPDVRASLEKVAPTFAATAVVAVVANADPTSAELWVVDRMTGKTVVRRVHADGSRPLAGNREIMKTLLTAREPSYREADLAVESSDADPGVVAERVVQAMRDWTGAPPKQ